MSLHTWCCQSLHKPSSYATFMLNPHWGRAATGQKVSCLCTQCHFSCVSTLCNPVDCGLPGFSARVGFSRQEYWSISANTGSIPIKNTIFHAALAANSPEYLVLPESLQPKQLHHLHTWPSQGQTQVLQGNLGSKPQWTTHRQRWK